MLVGKIYKKWSLQIKLNSCYHLVGKIDKFVIFRLEVGKHRSEHEFFDVVAELFFGVFGGEADSVGLFVFSVPEVTDHGGPFFLFFDNVDKLFFQGPDIDFFGRNFEGDVGLEVERGFFSREEEVNTEVNSDNNVAVFLSCLFGLLGGEVLGVELLKQKHAVVEMLELEPELMKQSILFYVAGDVCDGEIVLIGQLELVLEHLGASFVEHVLNAVELVDQVDLLAFGQLLQPHVLDLNTVCLLESFRVSHQCLPDYFGAFQLFAQCAVVVLQAVVSQSLLDQDLLAGATQKLQLH